VADGFETIGWVLKVQDKATAQVDKIVGVMDKQIASIAYATGNVSNAIAAWGERNGPAAKGVAALTTLVTRSLGSVGNSARVELQDALVRGFEAAAKGGIGALGNVMTKGLRGAEAGIVKFADAYVGAVVSGIEKAQSFWAFLSKREFTFGELFGKGAEGTKKLGLGFVSLAKSVGGATKAIGGAGAASFAGAWKAVGAGLRSGAQNIGTFFQKLISIEKIAKFFKGAGGVVGILLGPFGKLLDLFQPIIDLLVEQFTPAFETFSAILKTALGPFSMTLELIAQNLAHAIMPLVKPLASFLELAALHVGVLVAELLKGKPEGIMATMFGVIKKAQPVLMRVLSVLLDAGKQIGGTLLDGAMKLLPVIVDLGVKLLDAFLPLIPPLTKLAVALLEHVFIPALLAIAKILDEHVIPFIADWMPAVGILIEDTAAQVAEFWGNIGKYANDFKILFIDPITGWLTGLWDTIINFLATLPDKAADMLRSVGASARSLLDTLGLGNVGARVQGVFGALAQIVTTPLDTMKGVLNDYLISFANDALKWEVPVVGGSLAEALGLAPGYVIPKLAEGGIVEGQRGKGITANLGEAGPEAVIPLKREVLERTLAPIIPDIKFPALDRLVELAQGIDRTLSQGTLRVLTMNPEARDERGAGDIMLAPGMAGGGSW
jgi:hypothetical protein